MTPGKGFTKFLKVPDVTDPLKQMHLHAAGIDVHAKDHFVAVPVGSPPAGFVNPEKSVFGTNTADLEALALWLRQCGVTTVALQATGVYHLPLVDVLEKHQIAVIIVDARQTAHAPSRPKADVLECQWIQRLHTYGFLRASFVPGPEIRKLRTYQRHRDMLLRYAASHVQHMQKALEQMNCNLTETIKDVVGVTGMRIIRAIVGGERDPKKLTAYRQSNCKEYQRRLHACEQQIETCLQRFADQSAGRKLAARRPTKTKNAVHFELRPLLLQMAGVDVTAVEGIDETTALVLLSEIGPDLSAFADVDHFTSWLELSPNHRGSGGNLHRRRVKPSASRANRAFRLAASGCHHAKNALGSFYRRLAARIGAAKALVATARKIAEHFYNLLTQ